jgi:hypothetical protein
MCKWLPRVIAILALALVASPAPAWHHYRYAPVGFPVAPAAVGYAVPSAYAAPSFAVSSFAVPATGYAVPATSFAVPASSFAAPAYGYAAPASSFAFVSPSSVVLSQSAPGAGAQAASLSDLANLLNSVRQITDTLGGLGGGRGNAQLSATVSDHEKRIRAIEAKLKLRSPKAGGGTSGLRQFHPSSADGGDAGEEDANVEDAAPQAAANTPDALIQQLLQTVQATHRANAARDQALVQALPAIDYKIALLNGQIAQLQALKSQLGQPPQPMPPAGGKEAPKKQATE